MLFFQRISILKKYFLNSLLFFVSFGTTQNALLELILSRVISNEINLNDLHSYDIQFKTWYISREFNVILNDCILNTSILIGKIRKKDCLF